MLRSYLKPINFFLFAVLFLCLHAVCLAVFRPYLEPIATYPFLILAPSLALAGCLWRTRISSPRARLLWALFSVGLILWNCGMLLSAWEDQFRHTPFSVAFFSDFVYFLYGVPVLLAVSSPAESERLPLFIWMDGIQAALTAYLTYITIFSVVPFTFRTAQPISLSLLTLTYDVENLILAGAATLRLLAQPKKGEERRFYQILCSFLWAYVVFAGIYNHVSAITEGHSLDLLVDVPFLVLAAATIFPLAQRQEPTQAVPKKPLALFIDNSSPIFYTLALSALGLTIVRSHFYIGIVAIILALVVYGIRVITLQGRYMQSQQALQLARDRLEEISLRDGLTNVANRRCFDQTLASEWNRAVRMQHPMSLLLIDIDYFKTLNDRYGHPSGDQCLIAVAAAMQSVLTRSGDLLARYGGEEFAVILPATGRSGAELVASTMRDAVRSLRIKNETSMGDFTTVSIGIAVEELPQTGSPASLIEAADRALYKAKVNGRDRIEHY